MRSMIEQKRLRQWLLPVILLMITFLQKCVYAAPGYEQIASSSERSISSNVLSYGMTPVYGFDIKDGVYSVKVTCSSSFFRIAETELTVQNGEMTALLHMSSDSYEYVFAGSSSEAASALLTDYIPCKIIDGDYTFQIPVCSLNAIIQCAAFSKNTHKWYDRNIVFDASSLPDEAVSYHIPDYELIREAITQSGLEPEQSQSEQDNVDRSEHNSGSFLVLGSLLENTSENSNDSETTEPAKTSETTGEEIGFEDACEAEEADGSYSIDVTMTGGSGRASVSSPTWFYVRDGKAYAKLLWSSTYYDYMIVNGKTYYNETTDGSNSTFTIPVTVFDEPMQVIADTTAMGDPVEIEYALTFYKDSVGNLNLVPQEAAKKVLVIALAVIVFGGILNYFVKKKRR